MISTSKLKLKIKNSIGQKHTLTKGMRLRIHIKYLYNKMSEFCLVNLVSFQTNCVF